MNIVLYSNKFHENWLPFFKQLIGILLEMEFKVQAGKKLHQSSAKQIIEEHQIPVIAEKDIPLYNPDVMLVIGGDGTLLSSIQYIKKTHIPLMGINTGRLGFLASVSKEEMRDALQLLKQNKFILDKRTLLQVKSNPDLFTTINFALNELTIHKNDSSSMITIHAYVDGQYLNSYWADGLIISTPTGSTAYSLSCGGPIVLADTETFIITPIAPHNLNVRPIVISDKKTITLKIEGRSNKFLVSLDSFSTYINSDTELIITKSDFNINLIKLSGKTFFETIRNKLLWGLDKRN